MPFKISKFPHAEAQLRALAKRATDLGIYQAFSDALARIEDHMQDDPLEWGDPKYNLSLPGGVVCHGMEWPLVVHFAVYQADNVVCLLDIIAMPRTPLADS